MTRHRTTIRASKSKTRSTTMVAIVDEMRIPLFCFTRSGRVNSPSRAGRSEMVINPMAVMTKRGHCGYFIRGAKMMPQR